MSEPTISFVVPAKDEADQLPATLDSIHATAAGLSYELLVVDGDSDDETVTVAREHDARVWHDPGTGQGRARHVGALAASGRWLAFIDADTHLRRPYADQMLTFVREKGLAGAGSRCRVVGGWRTRPFEILFNQILPRLTPPPFPGFNVFVDRTAYFDVGGFRSGPNEDMAFSCRLGASYPTGVCPTVLVDTSGRRIENHGIVRTVGYYTTLEFQRQRQGRHWHSR